MPAQRKDRPPAGQQPDQVRAELRRIRSTVAGVTGSLAATSDGLVVAHDIPDAEPSQIAALAAATLALASRATLATGCGTFREAVARGTDGYLAVYAAGPGVIVAVIGKSSLNVGMLQYRAREIIERIAEHATAGTAAGDGHAGPGLPGPGLAGPGLPGPRLPGPRLPGPGAAEPATARSARGRTSPANGRVSAGGGRLSPPTARPAASPLPKRRPAGS
jgi:uncharacterized protein